MTSILPRLSAYSWIVLLKRSLRQGNLCRPTKKGYRLDMRLVVIGYNLGILSEFVFPHCQFDTFDA